ncbi:MAG: SDR family oxidoreductase [Actinomycetota bacterium]|nr:SDR family oxidoreductase [Actinomycetota bacterium]
MSNPTTTGEGLLAGRVALVTGGASGIGLGMATAMAQHGAAVVLACRRTETGEPAAEALRADGHDAICIRCDVTRPGEVHSAVAKALERHGRLDCLVHNAVAGQTGGALVDRPGTGWRLLVASSLRASFECAQAAHGALRETGGSLVLLTSAAGMEGSEAMPLYGAAKAAQRGLAKGLADEWGPDGIRVNCVAPLARTPALAGAIEADPSLGERLEARTPLGRIGDPAEDIGPVAVFLASDLSRHVTGQTVSVDGGGFRGL